MRNISEIRLESNDVNCDISFFAIHQLHHLQSWYTQQENERNGYLNGGLQSH